MKVDNYIKILQKKWSEVPAGDVNRLNTSSISNLSDNEVIKFWEDAKAKATQGEYFKVRGWYHTLYKDSFIGKSLMDLGSGFGIDGITFAQNGVNVTFVDIVKSNLDLIKRICDILHINNVDFLHIEDLNSLKKTKTKFDVIWAQGSMINAPFDIMKEEVYEVLKHLKTGGRWIELAYPKERWLKEGSMSFESWGDKTDGGAPWVEWYDLDKLLKRLSPSKFETVLTFNFYNDDFNWFDLKKISNT